MRTPTAPKNLGRPLMMMVVVVVVDLYDILLLYHHHHHHHHHVILSRELGGRDIQHAWTGREMRKNIGCEA